MIYIAGPYYDPDPNVIRQRMNVVYEVMAAYTRKGFIAVSPMLMHPVVEQYDLPNTFDFWDKYSLELLGNCDSMTVIKLAGWDRSRGVRAEIRHCEDIGIPVTYLNTDTQFDMQI